MNRAALAVTTVADQAADALRRKIMAGELAEGSSLRQDALAAELGISRIPLREALVQLEGEGLVKIVAHKGAVVAGLSIDEISELFMLRSVLEPLLLKRSAPRLTANDYAQLDAILADYRQELAGQHTTRWGELNTRLHAVLLSRADQPRTAAIVDTLLLQTDRYTRLQLSLSADSIRQAQQEHQQLVDLCRSGDVRGAAALLKRHIAHASRDLEQFIAVRRRAASQ
ncbi:GntR family transcriptional regulator [Duganella sp. Leaf126]|uniref:GntR family transcriptional regulator n=1 Tax=Duganella sp. Leaf126 TaxID=1736266 RepID=UPI0006F4C689|nr:GntR family transcriptional regulator [Duganella sp. Leaf126]KQQ33005.1 GntR family transcriptional regulator [Duganella sp. Leaf126]